jgi:sugar phosphate permease
MAVSSIASSAEMRRRYHRRWLIWVMSVLAHTVGTFNRAAMAPMADRLMADFDIGAIAFGSLGAVYFYVYAAMQLPSGTLADTLGPRKTITIGLLVSAAGALLMSTAPSFQILYAGRLLVSFGVSVAWISIIKIIMEWFRPREVATVTGLSSAVAHLGQLAASTPLALLILYTGWRMSFVAIAAVSMVLAIAGWLIIKNSPAVLGLPTINELDEGEKVSQKVSLEVESLTVWQRFKIVFGDRNIWLLFLLGFGAFGSFATLYHNWIVIYIMQSYRVERDFAATFVLVATIGFMIGAPFIGFLSDSIMHSRRWPPLIFTSLSFSCLLLIVIWNDGKPPIYALYLLSFIIGLGSSVIPVLFGCVRDIARPATRGVASGLVNMGGFAGAAIAQPLFGYILDRDWQGEMMGGAPFFPLEAFQHGLFLCCTLAALGVLAALLMKETHCQQIYDELV